MAVEWVASGAGSSTFNGDYEPYSTLNGKTSYKHVSNSAYIAWSGSKWVMLASHSWPGTAYYEGAAGESDLPANTWTVSIGSAPAPTVSAPPAYESTGAIIQADIGAGVNPEEEKTGADVEAEAGSRLKDRVASGADAVADVGAFFTVVCRESTGADVEADAGAGESYTWLGSFAALDIQAEVDAAVMVRAVEATGANLEAEAGAAVATAFFTGEAEVAFDWVRGASRE